MKSAKNCFNKIFSFFAYLFIPIAMLASIPIFLIRNLVDKCTKFTEQSADFHHKMCRDQNKNGSDAIRKHLLRRKQIELYNWVAIVILLLPSTFFLYKLEIHEGPTSILKFFLGFFLILLNYSWIYYAFRLIEKREVLEHGIQNLEKEYESVKSVDEAILKNDNFLVYLRDFESESKADESMVHIMPSGPQFIYAPPHNRRERIEKLLFKDIPKNLKVFGLSNYLDCIENPTASRLNAIESGWHNIFKKIAHHAAYIFILVESFGSGLEYEIRYLEEKGKANKCILVTSKEIFNQMKFSHSLFVGKILCWVELDLDQKYPKPKLPKSVIHLLQSTVQRNC